MKKDGRELEKVVWLIQEALKDFPETEVLKNHKLENRSGRLREIDVLIKSRINGLNIQIAIECKDYNTPVSVEKIEAFNSKCERITGISKKVFVATKGYQADAIEAAKYFDIELYDVENISPGDIASWFPVNRIYAKVKIKCPLSVFLDVVDPEKEGVDIDWEKDLVVHFENENMDSISLFIFIWNNIVVPNNREIQAHMLYDFMRFKAGKKEKSWIEGKFSCDMKGTYVIDNKGKKLGLDSVSGEIVGYYEEREMKISYAKQYQKSGKGGEVRLASVDLDDETSASIVYTEKGLTMFQTEKKGDTKKMSLLSIYDPKTDTIRSINSERGS